MSVSVDEQDDARSQGASSQLKGLKVLVIDDSKTIRRTAETLLAKPRRFGKARGSIPAGSAKLAAYVVPCRLGLRKT